MVDVFVETDDGMWRRTTGLHRQRHWERTAIERLAGRAGLEVLDVRGQRSGAVIDEDLNELVHTKAIYVARRRKEGPMRIGGP